MGSVLICLPSFPHLGRGARPSNNILTLRYILRVRYFPEHLVLQSDLVFSVPSTPMPYFDYVFLKKINFEGHRLKQQRGSRAPRRQPHCQLYTACISGELELKLSLSMRDKDKMSARV